MAGPATTNVLEVQHHAVCRSRHRMVWSAGDNDEVTLIDLSSIALEGATVDADGAATGGVRPLGIKLLSIKGQMVGDIRLAIEAKGVIADEDLYMIENNTDTFMPIDKDFRGYPNGGLKPKVSELLIGDTDWDQQTNVTATQDTTIKKVGADSVKLAIGAGFTTGLLASDEITAANLSPYSGVGFWIRSSIALQAADLSFLLDDTASSASQLETLPIPALVADTWRWVELAFATPSLLTAIVSMGLRSDRDFGAASVYIDGIRVKKFANPRTTMGAIGDIVCTSTNGASGDFCDLDLEWLLIWDGDSYRGI